MSGEVLYNGKKLNKRAKRQVGYVMQDDLLYESLTVYETVRSSTMCRDLGCPISPYTPIPYTRFERGPLSLKRRACVGEPKLLCLRVLILGSSRCLQILVPTERSCRCPQRLGSAEGWVELRCELKVAFD